MKSKYSTAKDIKYSQQKENIDESYNIKPQLARWDPEECMSNF